MKRPRRQNAGGNLQEIIAALNDVPDDDDDDNDNDSDNDNDDDDDYVSQRHERNRLAQQRRRASESIAQAAARRIFDNHAHQQRRADESEEQADARRDNDRHAHQQERANESEEQAAARRDNDRHAHQQERANESEEQAAARRESARLAQQARRAAENDSHPQQQPIQEDPPRFELPLADDFVCNYCGSVRIVHTSRGLCCQEGRIRIQELQDLPQQIADFFRMSSVPYTDHTRLYNNLLSFTAIGAHSSDPIFLMSGHVGFSHPEAGASLHVGGRLYHRCMAANVQTSPIRFWVLGERDDPPDTVNQELLSTLQNTLISCCPHVHTFRQLQLEALRNPDVNAIPMRVSLEFDDSRRDTVAILTDTSVPRPGVVFYYQQQNQRNNGDQEYVPVTSPLYDPLQYPLLFPFGEHGWGIFPGSAGRSNDGNATNDNNDGFDDDDDVDHDVDAEGNQRRGNRRVTLLRWTRLLVMRPSGYPGGGGSRFTGTALGSEWILDQWLRIEDLRLGFLAAQQERLSRQDEFIFAEREGLPLDMIGRRVFLSSSFVGGPRYRQRNLEDVMAIASQRGPHHFLITVTLNPRIPAITERLRENETAYTRPDITTQVFNELLRATVRYIKLTMFQGLGGVSWLVWVIEFQKRGLPHAHILVRARRQPTLEELPEYILAELPDQSQNAELYELVRDQMTHVCRADKCRRRPRFDGLCKYRFPAHISPQAWIDDLGYTNYRRQTELDRFIVPYNPGLALFTRCHVNVELHTGVRAIGYVFKYVSKGVDFARARVGADGDEIRSYQSFRYVSACEATWRLFSNDTIHREPAVRMLHVHLEGQNFIRFSPGGRETTEAPLLRASISELDAYFSCLTNGPAELLPVLRGLLYSEFHARYLYRQINQQQQVILGQNEWIVDVGERRIAVHERRMRDCVCRLQRTLPTAGERYYLRLILLSRPCLSYVEARLHAGIQHDSYQEAARAMGLLARRNEYEIAFDEAVASFATAGQLRLLLVTLAVDGSPVATLFAGNCEILAADFEFALRDTIPNAEERQVAAQNQMIRAFSRSFAEFGRRATEFGFPEPQDDDDGTVFQQGNSNHAQLRQFVQEHSEALSDEQRAINQAVIDADNAGNGGCFFIAASAGTGKTFLARFLIATLRLAHRIVIPVATSALAALQYEGGRTAHSTFGIPIRQNTDRGNERQPATSNISGSSPQANLLRAAAVILWDEMGMADRGDVELVDRFLQEIRMRPGVPFGGIVFLGLGDFRQIPPVVPGGTEIDILNSSIVSSNLWRNFMRMPLTRQFRAAADQGHRDFVISLGDGTFQILERGSEDIVNNVALHTPDGRHYNHTTSVETAVNFAFPDLTNYADVARTRILTFCNQQCSEMNTILLERVPGEVVTLLGSDSLSGETGAAQEAGNSREQARDETDWLHNLNDNNVPSHRLQLKVGALVMLLKNISIAEGLANNVIAVVRMIRENTVAIEPIDIATGALSGRLSFIPRVTFQFRVSRIEVTRRQFPFKLAYAVTSHKAQGMTLQRGVIDLRRPPFTHGQLYVAFSRFCTLESILVLTNQANIIDTPAHIDTAITRCVISIDLLERVEGPLQIDQARRERLCEFIIRPAERQSTNTHQNRGSESSYVRFQRYQQRGLDVAMNPTTRTSNQRPQTFSRFIVPLIVEALRLSGVQIGAEEANGHGRPEDWIAIFPRWRDWARALLDHNPELQGNAANVFHRLGIRDGRLYWDARTQNRLTGNLPLEIHQEIAFAALRASTWNFNPSSPQAR